MKSQYLRHRFLSSYLTEAFVGLLTALPSDVNLEGTELASEGYTRQNIEFRPLSDSPEECIVENGNTVTFPSANSWIEIVGAGIYDSEKDGHLLFWNKFKDPITVSNNDVFRFRPTEIRISEH